MSEFNLKNTILTDIISDEYLNRRIYMQQPIMWWKNDVTQLNATNLNKISMGIRDVQQEFSIESHNIQYLLGQAVKNSAGWLSTENASGTAEIFNDYDNNQALADYSHAEGHMTKAGHGYSSLEDGHVIYSGIGSHAQGEGTVAIGDYQFVQGRWNVLDAVTHPNNSGELIPTNESNDVKGTYAHIVGAGTDDTKRKNIYTLDWSGSGWFANELTADGNVTFGTTGNNRHKFKGKTLFENAVKINSNLGVYGDTKLDKNLTVNGATSLTSTLTVSELTTLNGNLNVNTDATIAGLTTTDTLQVNKSTDLLGNLTVNGLTDFKNNVTFNKKDDNTLITFNSKASFKNTTTFSTDVTFNDKGAADQHYSVIINPPLTVNGDATFSNIKSTGKISSDTDLTILDSNGEDLLGLQEVYDHLNYKDLDVTVSDKATEEEKLAKQTVPNAIAKVKADLIGTASISPEEVGLLKISALSDTSIYGVAQYSINLVKNLLNAYILDSDDAEDADEKGKEARSAIDKLIEVADWIQDDSAGAGKIIIDVENLSKNKLDSSTYNDFKTKEYDVLSKLISDNKANWDTAFANNHIHTNKSLLDGITDTSVANWNTAYSQRHTHSNKDLLDGITAARLTNWDASAALLDGVSQEAIDGVIADGARITENTIRLDDHDELISELTISTESLQETVTNLNERIAELESKLNTLITHGAGDPTSATNTSYYVKYE